jgi:hypothetical protein
LCSEDSEGLTPDAVEPENSRVLLEVLCNVCSFLVHMEHCTVQCITYSIITWTGEISAALGCGQSVESG